VVLGAELEYVDIAQSSYDTCREVQDKSSCRDIEVSSMLKSSRKLLTNRRTRIGLALFSGSAEIPQNDVVFQGKLGKTRVLDLPVKLSVLGQIGAKFDWFGFTV